jgi:hypothetical protein
MLLLPGGLLEIGFVSSNHQTGQPIPADNRIDFVFPSPGPPRQFGFVSSIVSPTPAPGRVKTKVQR